VQTTDRPVNVFVVTAIINVTLSPLCPPLVTGQRVRVSIHHVLLLLPHVIIIIIVVSTAAGLPTAAQRHLLLPSLLPSLPSHI
jgi:hypothetical protein